MGHGGALEGQEGAVVHLAQRIAYNISYFPIKCLPLPSPLPFPWASFFNFNQNHSRKKMFVLALLQKDNRSVGVSGNDEIEDDTLH